MESTKKEWVRVKGNMVNKSNTCLIRVQERKSGELFEEIMTEKYPK